jgi:hypothetical protein
VVTRDTDSQLSMTNRTPGPVPLPSKHQLSLMIWLCVFPTLTVINLALGDLLKTFCRNAMALRLATGPRTTAYLLPFTPSLFSRKSFLYERLCLGRTSSRPGL